MMLRPLGGSMELAKNVRHFGQHMQRGVYLLVTSSQRLFERLYASLFLSELSSSTQFPREEHSNNECKKNPSPEEEYCPPISSGVSESFKHWSIVPSLGRTWSIRHQRCLLPCYLCTWKKEGMKGWYLNFM